MFTMRDVYPHYGVIETTERTIPIEQNRKDPFAKEGVGLATPDEKKSIWLALLAILILLIIFVIGGGIAVGGSVGGKIAIGK